MDLESYAPEVEYPVKQKNFSDYLFAGCVCFFTCILFAIISAKTHHWFLLPIFLCGTIIGSDGIVWFRRKCDVFDLKAIVGLYGFYFFFLSPLIYMALGGESALLINNPPDWRPWLGYMAFVNLVGIITYKLFQRVGFSGAPQKKCTWYVYPGRTWFVLNAAIILAFFAQAVIFIRIGGIRGIMHARFGGEAAKFAGMGSFRAMSAALPLLCFIAFTLYIYSNRMTIRSMVSILFSLAVFGLFQLYISGGFSSRIAVLSSVFWVLGIIHYFLRPLSQKFLILLLIPGMFFMWVYTFYKALGPQLFEGAERSSIAELAQRTGRTFGGLLIGDLSRVDIQAYILYVQEGTSSGYDLKYGKTYPQSIIPVFPRWIWRSKPADSGKVRAGTELQYGKGYYVPYTVFRSERAYGLAGEAMLNFGFLGVPFVYAVWGFLIGRFRRYVSSFEKGDLRFLLVPYIVLFLLNMLMWDMDNYFLELVLRSGFPLLVIFMMSGKMQSCPYSDEELGDTAWISNMEGPGV
ncbi:MAG: hypothetical protein ACQ9MH_16560 [Nitrospinales bacterium]